MARNWTRWMPLAAAVLIIQALLWEFARMKPDYGFIVMPWSIRGYETIHGTISTVIGLALLVSALAVLDKRSQNVATSVGIVVAMVVMATVIAAIFGDKNIDVKGLQLFPLVNLLAVVISTLSLQLARRALGGKEPLWMRFAIWIASFAIMNGIIFPLLVDAAPSLHPAVVVLFVSLVLGALAVAFQPRELASNRMFINVILLAWAVFAFSGGGIRSTLLRKQFELDNIGGQYKDTQVAMGYFVAMIGFALLFVGAVALWAKRRDYILNQQRAARQREAAEKSAAELALALAAAAAQTGD